MSSPRVAELSQKLAESALAFREAYAGMVSVIAEIQDADIAKEAGYTRLSLLIADVARLNPRHASRLISHATAIAEVMTPTGHVMPARLPVVREALLAGELDGEQVEAIVRVVKKIPAHAPGDTTEIVEKHLVGIAREAPAATVVQHGEALLARIDADGVAPKEELAEPKNEFRYRRDAARWMHFSGKIEPESAEELDSMLGSLAKPDGPTDERSAVQRLGDAFCDVVHHAIDSPDHGVRGGEKPHLNAIMDYSRLLHSIGSGDPRRRGPAACGGGAADRLRREPHPRRAQRRLRAAGPGSHSPVGDHSAAGGIDRSGQGMCVSELHAPGAVVGCSPHQALVGWRRYQSR